MYLHMEPTQIMKVGAQGIRVVSEQGKQEEQGIWIFILPGRENTRNLTN